MAKLTQKLSTQDLYTSSNGVEILGAEVVGVRVNGLNGKEFSLALNGAVALVAGNLLQSVVEDTQFENMAVGTAAVVGQTFIQVTNGTTTVVPNYFKGGSIMVYTAGTVAIGEEYTIIDVTGTLTTGGALKVFVDRPLRYAFTTGATVTMKQNLYSGVIQMPASTPTGIAVAIAPFAIAASTSTAPVYGYVQTRGIAACLSDGSTFAVGSAVGTPSGTAGCVTVYAAATTKQAIGVALQAAASAHAIAVNLTGF
jgi:hypothetical protein